MSAEAALHIRAQVALKSDLTLAELQAKLMVEQDVRFSIGRLWGLLRQLHLRLKKKSLHAGEGDTEANRERRVGYLETIRSTTSERLIYVDQSGVTTSMTRL